MKKKKCLIPILIIIAILVSAVGGVNILNFKGYEVSTGIYLEAKDGTAILIDEKTPIKMSNRTKRKLFDNLDIGDKILIIHKGIAETYPAKTGVCAVFEIKDGTTGAIPPSVIEELIELGWIEVAEDIELELPKGTFVDDTRN